MTGILVSNLFVDGWTQLSSKGTCHSYHLVKENKIELVVPIRIHPIQ